MMISLALRLLLIALLLPAAALALRSPHQAYEQAHRQLDQIGQYAQRGASRPGGVHAP